VSPGSVVSIGIVEDSDEDFTAFARIVRRDAPGTRLQRWTRADDALASLGAGHTPAEGWPSILVVDLNLPGMDGATLVEQLRTSAETRTLPIFVLSGSGLQHDIDRCYRAGANAFLTKPSNSSELSTLLQMLFQSLLIFRAPTPPAAGPFDGEPLRLAPPTVDGHRDEYERQLLADRDSERRARVRAEALERLSERLAGLATREEVERALVGELLGGELVERADVYRLSPGADRPERTIEPGPEGTGWIATFPLESAPGGALFGSLVLATAGPIDDEDRKFLQGAASLGGRAVARTAKLASLARSSRGDATGLPNQRWWKAIIDGEVRRARRANAALSVVLIQLEGFDQLSLTEGQVAGDRVLLAVVDAWRRCGYDLYSRFGGEELAAVLPGLNYRDAKAVVAKVRVALGPQHPAICAIAQWSPSESGDELVARAEAVLEATEQLAGQL
jgi:PleD family two-component response regulator